MEDLKRRSGITESRRDKTATVIVCGYGKERTWAMEQYVAYSLFVALKEKAENVIFSGGNTTDKRDGDWDTESEMMRVIALDVMEVHLTLQYINLVKEEKAYNTLGNLLHSKRKIGSTEKIIVVCNKAHLVKTRIAAVRIFGIKAARRITFYSFPLVLKKREIFRIYLKTIGETIGYFLRPVGRRIEWLQWRLRSGRKKKIDFWQFCLRYIPTGDLL